jgi:hypothetical protein
VHRPRPRQHFQQPADRARRLSLSGSSHIERVITNTPVIPTGAGASATAERRDLLFLSQSALPSDRAG